MRTSTTNRFLFNALRTVCCAGALTACSAWATVVPWQLDARGHAVTANGRGIDSAATATDTSRQFLFESPAANRTIENSSLPQNIRHSDESLLFAASNAQTQSAAPMQNGGALASAFDEDFVSVPTVRFESVIAGPKSVAVATMAAVSTDPAPVPEMSALFPIVGLIAAVSCTRILRRRRAAQQSASRNVA